MQESRIAEFVWQFGLIIVILIFAVVFPEALLAVITYPVFPCIPVGDPESAHVVVLMDRPVGKAGDETQFVIVPVTVGVCVPMDTVRTNVNGVPA